MNEFYKNILENYDNLGALFMLIGVLSTFNILVSIVCGLKNCLNSYVLPKICPSVNLVERYGKWAVVTGCTQGIGKSYAEELARRGMSIVLISRSQSKLEECAAGLSNKYGKANTERYDKKL